MFEDYSIWNCWEEIASKQQHSQVDGERITKHTLLNETHAYFTYSI